MSAFVVSNEHINALINFGLETTYWNPATQCCEEINRHTAQHVGQILMDANQRSVNYRYQEHDTAPMFKFNLGGGFTAVQILKACHCLDYQCCENEDWPQTLAYGILETIKSKAERLLPGYESAAWEIRPKEDSPKLTEITF